MSLNTNEFSGKYNALGTVVTLDPNQVHTMGISTLSVSPAGQLSTNAYVPVTGSVIDTGIGGQTNCGYQVSVVTNGVTAKVQGSYDGVNYTDLITPVAIGAGVSVALGSASPGALANYTSYRFFRIAIIDTVGGTHGTATTVGFAK